MCLVDKIINIYPELTIKDFYPFTGCIEVQDNSDGLGPYIKTWNYVKPQPTQTQLNSL